MVLQNEPVSFVKNSATCVLNTSKGNSLQTKAAESNGTNKIETHTDTLSSVSVKNIQAH